MSYADAMEHMHSTFPNMMKDTKLLIVDHDVTRFHSFDILRNVILDPKYIDLRIKGEIPDKLIGAVDIYEMLNIARYESESVNVMKYFHTPETDLKSSDYSKWVNTRLANESMLITKTDMSNALNLTFMRNGITGYLLKYTNDKHEPMYKSKLTVYEHDDMFDYTYIVSIIRKHMINAVLCSNATLAIMIALQCIKVGFTEPISFIIANYRYNYDKYDKKYLIHGTPEMCKLEYKYKYEFGNFDPFTELTIRTAKNRAETEGE